MLSWGCVVWRSLTVRHPAVSPTMQTMGSISLSLATSIQVISMAAGSPGEQGVRRSSTITWRLLREGPRTCSRRSNRLGVENNNWRFHPCHSTNPPPSPS